MVVITPEVQGKYLIAINNALKDLHWLKQFNAGVESSSLKARWPVTPEHPLRTSLDLLKCQIDVELLSAEDTLRKFKHRLLESQVHVSTDTFLGLIFATRLNFSELDSTIEHITDLPIQATLWNDKVVENTYNFDVLGLIGLTPKPLDEETIMRLQAKANAALEKVMNYRPRGSGLRLKMLH